MLTQARWITRHIELIGCDDYSSTRILSHYLSDSAYLAGTFVFGDIVPHKVAVSDAYSAEEGYCYGRYGYAYGQRSMDKRRTEILMIPQGTES